VIGSLESIGVIVVLPPVDERLDLLLTISKCQVTGHWAISANTPP
jgi:hypothetical protein